MMFLTAELGEAERIETTIYLRQGREGRCHWPRRVLRQKETEDCNSA
jgi:hypothetical protein